MECSVFIFVKYIEISKSKDLLNLTYMSVKENKKNVNKWRKTVTRT